MGPGVITGLVCLAIALLIYVVSWVSDWYDIDWHDFAFHMHSARILVALPLLVVGVIVLGWHFADIEVIIDRKE